MTKVKIPEPDVYMPYPFGHIGCYSEEEMKQYGNDRAKGAQQAEQVPDAYQFRMRADWVPNWGEWGACNKERHDMYLRFPKMHSWNYETRELYAAHKVAQQASCEWKKDPDNEMGDTYHSNCGESWSFVDGGPKENRVSYCHHCGKPVKLAAPKGVV